MFFALSTVLLQNIIVPLLEKDSDFCSMNCDE